MCGICGMVSRDGVSESDIHPMINSIHRRGPDDEGFFTANTGNTSLGFGFKRLSIIDLSVSGHQPMTDEATGNTIVFNGEIYNYREIKKELQQLGHQFKSNSDTEVILKAYAQWQHQCINRFLGMFAFVIFDKNKNKLFGARDRFGVKPFYYHHSSGNFIFCSEIKGIRNSKKVNLTIDMQSVGDFMKYGYTLSSHTIYNEIKKLKPGHYFYLDLISNSFDDNCYWNYDSIPQSKGKRNFAGYKDELKSLLNSAFSYRMVADVPVGIFLSGGVDSSLLAAVLSKEGGHTPDAYTIGFDEKDFDESDYAKQVANHLGIKHHVFKCTSKDALEIFSDFYKIYDEPFSDTSGIPTHLVSKFAAKNVKVALSADGSDELFTGYTKYAKALNYFRYRDQLGSIPGVKNILKGVLSGNANVINHSRIARLKLFLNDVGNKTSFDIITCGLINDEVDILVKGNYRRFDENMLRDSNISKLIDFSSYDVHSYLTNDILQKVDMASMYNSLEVREPFLDHRIAEFAYSLPDEYKLKNNIGKFILKDILKDYIPEHLINRPKMGFSIPLEHWCRNELKPLFLDTLNDSVINNHSVFNSSAISELKTAFIKDKKMDFQRLFRVFSFLMWEGSI